MPNPDQETIEWTFGPLVTGVMIQQLLLGILCIQVFDYYRVFDKDKMFYKVLVGVLFVLNILQGVIDFHVLYRTSVTYFGDYDGFDLQQWSMWSEPGLTAIIGFVAQVFFLERCYKATGSWYILTALSLFVLVSLGAGLAVSITFFQVQRFSHLSQISTPITVWLISTSITDIAIAGVLGVSLFRSKTPFKSTGQVISRIIRLSMETSATTAIVALLNLILYIALPLTTHHLLPQFSMCRVYAHTVMVTLASRTGLRTVLLQGHTSCDSTYVVTRLGGGQSTAVNTATAADKWNIKVTTTVEQTYEENPNPEKADIELGLTTTVPQQQQQLPLPSISITDHNVEDDEDDDRSWSGNHSTFNGEAY